MGAMVAWLIAADALAQLARRRADGPRTTAWLSLASLAVLTASIAWGVFGSTRHGKPPPAAAVHEEAAP
jgi:cytochrome b